jgi:hypothetical protein
MPCSAKSFSAETSCGKPTLIVGDKPYHKDFCLDCIVISAFVGGQLHAAGGMMGLKSNQKSLIESCPSVIKTFLEAQPKAP